MSDPIREKRISASIAYNDYVALLCSMEDAGWTWRRPAVGDDTAVPPVRNHQDFARNCYDYGHSVEAHCRSFKAANNDAVPDALPRHLYNPASFFVLGHPDDLAIVLLDDFDPVHHLTTSVSQTLEDVSLGFCPRLGDLVLGGDTSAFCELHDLLDPEQNRCGQDGDPKEIRARVGDSAPWVHRFQRVTPLLTFTKYKMDALASLGEGLLVQQAMFKAMAKMVQATLELLRKSPTSPLIRPEHVNTARCCFLDMQGTEEIATLMFTQNFSVALTLVGALRSLTFGDVFEADCRTKNLLNDSRAHQEVVRVLAKRPERGQRTVPEWIQDSHVFRWTHSSLAVAPQSLRDGDYDNCEGYVKAISEIQLVPGHRDRVAKRAVTAPRDPQNVQEYDDYLTGTGDMMLFHGQGLSGTSCKVPPSTGSNLPLVRTASFLEALRENLNRFGRTDKGDPGRDIVKLSSTLIIPVPRCLCVDQAAIAIDGGAEAEPAESLSDLLPILSDRLCCPPGSDEDASTNGHNAGQLSMRAVKSCFQQIGMPSSLRRAIENLYQNYATILADPMVFDVVLDLYDTFVVLHAVLTKHLPGVFQSTAGEGSATHTVLDEGRAMQLAALVDVLHNALTHRVFKASKGAIVRDMSSDLRGGMNQILLAADAPVKCALGLVRHFASASGVSYRLGERLGALARISFAPGAECCSLRLGVEHEAQLAFFDVDVLHLMHVPSYYDFLHDGCHLAFDLLNNAIAGELPPRITDAFEKEWRSELFATLLCNRLVFDEDVDTASFHYVASFSRSLKSVGLNDRDTIARFTEVLIRCYISHDLVDSHLGDPAQGAAHIRPRQPETEAIVVNTFKAFVRRVGPFFSEYERLWHNGFEGPAGKYCLAQFWNVYERMHEHLPWVWERVNVIVRCYRRHAILPDSLDGLPSPEELLEEVEAGLAEGRPFACSLCRVPLEKRKARVARAQTEGGREDWDEDQEDYAIDRLFMVCTLLHYCIRNIRNAEGKHTHLVRQAEGTLGYRVALGAQKSGSRKWFEFQSERGNPAMFCPLPTERRARLGEYVAILKTFWDISSKIRARRLCRMLQDNFPQPLGS